MKRLLVKCRSPSDNYQNNLTNKRYNPRGRTHIDLFNRGLQPDQFPLEIILFYP